MQILKYILFIVLITVGMLNAMIPGGDTGSKFETKLSHLAQRLTSMQQQTATLKKALEKLAKNLSDIAYVSESEEGESESEDEEIPEQKMDPALSSKLGKALIEILHNLDPLKNTEKSDAEKMKYDYANDVEVVAKGLDAKLTEAQTVLATLLNDLASLKPSKEASAFFAEINTMCDVHTMMILNSYKNRSYTAFQNPTPQTYDATQFFTATPIGSMLNKANMLSMYNQSIQKLKDSEVTLELMKEAHAQQFSGKTSLCYMINNIEEAIKNNIKTPQEFLREILPNMRWRTQSLIAGYILLNAGYDDPEFLWWLTVSILIYVGQGAPANTLLISGIQSKGYQQKRSADFCCFRLLKRINDDTLSQECLKSIRDCCEFYEYNFFLKPGTTKRPFSVIALSNRENALQTNFTFEFETFYKVPLAGAVSFVDGQQSFRPLGVRAKSELLGFLWVRDFKRVYDDYKTKAAEDEFNKAQAKIAYEQKKKDRERLTQAKKLANIEKARKKAEAEKYAAEQKAKAAAEVLAKAQEEQTKLAAIEKERVKAQALLAQAETDKLAAEQKARVEAEALQAKAKADKLAAEAEKARMEAEALQAQIETEKLEAAEKAAKEAEEQLKQKAIQDVLLQEQQEKYKEQEKLIKDVIATEKLSGKSALSSMNASTLLDFFKQASVIAPTKDILGEFLKLSINTSKLELIDLLMWLIGAFNLHDESHQQMISYANIIVKKIIESKTTLEQMWASGGKDKTTMKKFIIFTKYLLAVPNYVFKESIVPQNSRLTALFVLQKSEEKTPAVMNYTKDRKISLLKMLFGLALFKKDDANNTASADFQAISATGDLHENKKLVIPLAEFMEKKFRK